MKATNRTSFAQLMFCRGCCCGREDRGYPGVPVDSIKARWRERKLNRFVQLTISGCLGPCDQANVALVVAADRQIWLGDLRNDYEYEALAQWAEDCGRSARTLPLPAILATKEIRRWPEERSESASVLLPPLSS